MPRNTTSKSSSKTASKAAPRGTSKSSHDAIKLLTEDHRKVTDLFDEFEQMKKKDDNDDEAKQLLIETACAELTIHAQVEEEIFYPAAREAIEDMDLLDEAEVEHALAKQLVTELAAMQPGDDLYEAKFTVLGEYVKHHIEEEEKELFKKVKKADIDLDELGEEIRQRKMELRAELGIESDEEEEEDDETEAPSSTRKNIH
jgi:hemerythrin superfamily protein